MALGYIARKRLAILILVVGLPVYVLLAVKLVSLFDRPSILVELLVYVGLGVLWIMPLRRIFLGIGQPDPNDKGGPSGPPSA